MGTCGFTRYRADTQKQVLHGTRIASPGSQREEGLQGLEPTRRAHPLSLAGMSVSKPGGFIQLPIPSKCMYRLRLACFARP